MSDTHFVNGHSMKPPFPDGMETAVFAMGCFWGVERKFWQLPGVWVTAAGYAGGRREYPTYEQVCTGATGHAEVVRVVFDPAVTDYTALLKVFWETHDPTQGMRQGGDIGEQYRSVIFWQSDAQRVEAERTRLVYAAELASAGYPPITTQLLPAAPFWMAENYHQQYLAKNPDGYCGIGGTGVSCAI